MIGKLLGHTQVQTTARYAHLANESVKASGSRVGYSIGMHIKLHRSMLANSDEHNSCGCYVTPAVDGLRSR